MFIIPQLLLQAILLLLLGTCFHHTGSCGDSFASLVPNTSSVKIQKEIYAYQIIKISLNHMQENKCRNKLFGSNIYTYLASMSSTLVTPKARQTWWCWIMNKKLMKSKWNNGCPITIWTAIFARKDCEGYVIDHVFEVFHCVSSIAFPKGNCRLNSGPQVLTWEVLLEARIWDYPSGLNLTNPINSSIKNVKLYLNVDFENQNIQRNFACRPSFS